MTSIKHIDTDSDIHFEDFMKCFVDRVIFNTTYFGIQTFKNPLDFWVYQEIIWKHQPNVIVEIGNANGGSTLALAHLLDAMQRGRIIGIDIDQSHLAPEAVAHPRIQFIEGDACSLFPVVQSRIDPEETVMVIEDSSHTFENTLNVLSCYSALIKKGGYFIVEDSIVHHGVDMGPSPGPYEAIEQFMQRQKLFEIDRSLESFILTFNPKGFLKRIR